MLLICDVIKKTPHGVNDTTESDSVGSMTPLSQTQWGQGHRWVSMFKKYKKHVKYL